jgi:hypothetical protein
VASAARPGWRRTHASLARIAGPKIMGVAIEREGPDTNLRRNGPARREKEGVGCLRFRIVRIYLHLSRTSFSLSGFEVCVERKSKPDRLKPVLLALPADSAVARIFENDSAPCKIVANSVGCRKVTALARGLAFSDEHLNLGIA